MDIFKQRRKSFVEPGNVYFFTATINHWYRLLENDEVKQIIIDSLKNLSQRGRIEVYSFVVMPNHVHIIWKINGSKNEELPHVSFLKFTAHSFKKYLVKNDEVSLRKYAVEAKNKEYEFWQRDSLAFLLDRRETAVQKLDYIHANPLAAHWQLCDEPADYQFSSAKYYETSIDEFGFLKHIMQVF